jgi:hypothetical protein
MAHMLMPLLVVVMPLQSVAAAADTPPLVVPLHVEHGPNGDPRLGIDVGIGSRTVRVLFDTGSAGLRVLASAVNDPSVRRGGPVRGGGFYGSGLTLRGDEATAPLSLGGGAPQQTSFELVDGFGCAEMIPNCPGANGRTPEMFGTLFPGIFGASMTDPPRGRCCANPIEALPAYGKRFIVHAAFSGPSVTLGPDPAALAGFTMIDVARGVLPRGCVRVSSAAGEVCGDVLFDTGTPQIVVSSPGVVAQGPQPAGTTATLTVGAWSHAFAPAPEAPLRVAMRRGQMNRIVVGLAALQSVDLYFDLAAGRIGLRAL